MSSLLQGNIGGDDEEEEHRHLPLPPDNNDDDGILILLFDSLFTPGVLYKKYIIGPKLIN